MGPVTSPGAVRFAPLRDSLRDAAAFHRDSFPCDGEPRSRSPSFGRPFRRTLCAFRLGEPLLPSILFQVLTLLREERLPLRFQEDVGVPW
jgi:hypothetical protein